MIKTILYLIILKNIFSFLYYRSINKIENKRLILRGIKYIDHDLTNKSIYEKFEYYSVIGNKEKQLECFNEISNLNNSSKSQNNTKE
tara:strand:+ start:270 stop:530 length:261 start_codon:yes stop_codon:yes gene_type:complete